MVSSNTKTIRDIVGVTPECFQKPFALFRIKESFARTGMISKNMINYDDFIKSPDIFAVMNQNKSKWNGQYISSSLSG